MKKWTRLQTAVVIMTLIYMAAFLAMLIAHPGSDEFYAAFNNIYQIFPPLLSGIIGLIYYRQGPHSNRARHIGWLLIALACLSFAVGQCTWTYFETIRGITTPFPSLADLGYIGTYPLLLVGVLLLFGSMPVAGRTRQLLDSAIAASSLGVLSWYFIVQHVWRGSGVSLIGKCISVAYPLGDIAALFGAIVLLSNAWNNNALRRSLYFLAAGICGFTFFDTSFVWMTLYDKYQTGSWSDWTVSFGWISIGYAFLTRMWWIQKEQTVRRDPRTIPLRTARQIFMPYISVTATCLIICIYDYAQDGVVLFSTVAAGMFLMGLVIIRQFFTLFENRSLTLELRALNENLEKIVAERTEELEIQNRKILVMVEERNRFFRNVSHELRTPLTSVIGFAELLMDDETEPLTPGQNVQFKKITNSAHKLLNMVNDLLDISKAEAGKIVVHYSTVRLDEFIEQVVSNVAPIALGKSLQLKTDVPAGLPAIITDEQKLGQILTNLLSNAIKYTPRGSVIVRAKINGQAAAISVQDTGIGIPEDKLAEVFREFYRVQDGPSRERGTGLGLTIAQNFARLIGGRITVQSKERQGSIFTITIPVAPKNRRLR